MYCCLKDWAGMSWHYPESRVKVLRAVTALSPQESVGGGRGCKKTALSSQICPRCSSETGSALLKWCQRRLAQIFAAETFTSSWAERERHRVRSVQGVCSSYVFLSLSRYKKSKEPRFLSLTMYIVFKIINRNVLDRRLHWKRKASKYV